MPRVAAVHRFSRPHPLGLPALLTLLTLLTCLSIASRVESAGPDLRVVEAAKAQSWPQLQSLVKQRADVHAAQPDGATALHWAVYWDHIEAVDALLRAGAQVNASNEFGATPLWLACAEGRASLVDRLLRAGADPNLALRNGESPLMTASRAGNVEAVRLLIARGANVNAVEPGRNQTALMWAVAERHAEVTRVLVEAGANVGARSSVRRMLVNSGQDGIRRLSGDFADFQEEDQGGYSPLLFAARAGDAASVKLLVAAGAQVDETTPLGTSALVVAAHSGQAATADALLDLGADPNASDGGYTALHVALLRRNVSLAKKLLAHGADPNAVLRKATPNRRNSEDFALHPSWVGATPLWMAAKFSDVEFMKLLIAAGADPRFARPDGTTILLAVMADGPDRKLPTFLPPDRRELEQRTLEAINAAAELGLDVKATNAAGDTALHAAAARGFNRVIEFLVARGASVDATNKKGLTPLAVASAASQRAIQAAQLGAGSVAPTTSTTVELLRKLGASQ